MPPCYSTIIFDLGNVLLFHDNRRVDRALAELAGCAPEDATRRIWASGLWRHHDDGSMDSRVFHTEVCRRLGVSLSFEAFADLWRSAILTPNEPALQIVERLRGRYRLLVLSNTNALHIEHVRATYPIFEPFDHVIASCEVGCTKPDPAIFRLALERAGAEPRETIFIDDLRPYAEAAAALGLTGLHFTSARQLERDLTGLGVLAPV